MRKQRILLLLENQISYFRRIEFLSAAGFEPDQERKSEYFFINSGNVLQQKRKEAEEEDDEKSNFRKAKLFKWTGKAFNLN